MKELAEAVNALTVGVDGAAQVSPASTGRIFARNGYTQKIIEKAFFTRREAQRVASQWQIPLSCRVYVDEDHREGCAAQRRWAWSVRGARSDMYVASSAGARTNISVAMAHDRVLDWLKARPPPGQTSVGFLIFLTTLVLPGMTACVEGGLDVSPPGCVLVLFNVRIHDEVALERVRAAGVFVVLLPPYSPDFNPIEDVFSVGSGWLRRWSSPDHFNSWPMTAIDSMLLHITGDMCRVFVGAAVRHYNLYVPSNATHSPSPRWSPATRKAPHGEAFTSKTNGTAFGKHCPTSRECTCRNDRTRRMTADHMRAQALTNERHRTGNFLYTSPGAEGTLSTLPLSENASENFPRFYGPHSNRHKNGGADEVLSFCCVAAGCRPALFEHVNSNRSTFHERVRRTDHHGPSDASGSFQRPCRDGDQDVRGCAAA